MVADTQQSCRPRGPLYLRRLQLEQALAGYTINGAAQLGLEGEVGVIKAGLLADFIVLPQNPFETDVEKIHAIEPSATVVAGQLRSGGF